MPPRRSHKKSRAGCNRCKIRKVKCDEIHPICGPCSKHGVPCDFKNPTAVPSPPTIRRQSSEETSAVVRYASSSSSTASYTPFYYSPIGSPISIHPAADRTMELRLLHHYTAITSKTMATVNTPSTEEAWQIAIPGMAFESPCLMDAMLAISALHLRHLTPTDSSLVRAFHGYMASAFSQYSTSLANGVNASNAEALFSTSAMIAFQASALRRFYNEAGEEEFGQSGYTLPLQWFYSFQGVKTVVLSSWMFLRTSKRVQPIIQMQPALELDLNPSPLAFFTGLLEGLDEELQMAQEGDRLEIKQAYDHSVAYLNWAHSKPERPRILGFPATVSKRYVQLVEEEQPRALVIMACFFAMTRAVDDVWWLRGIAKKEVTGIMSLLPEDWWSRMEWPVRVSNHEGNMTEDIWGGCWHSEGEPKAEEGFNGDVRSHIDILAQIDSACEDLD